MEVQANEKSWLVKVGVVLLAVLSIYFIIKIVAEIKEYRFIGGGAPASNVISFSGEGEISASPDIAVVNITIREEDKTMQGAQDKVVEKETKVLDFLNTKEIAKKDIKAESYNSYPKYDYGAPCWGAYCRQEPPKIIGYETSEYLSIKIRDLEKIGEIVQGIGDVGISEINGPNFSIEKEEELKAKARKMAINEAKAKAETLARDLGVHLVRIVSFSEDGYYPRPMYEKAYLAGDSFEETVTSAPEIPVGENKITSNVTITYEIR